MGQGDDGAGGALDQAPCHRGQLGAGQAGGQDDQAGLARTIEVLGDLEAAGLVAEGGFQPLTLQPVNFEQLYAQRMQEMIAQQQGGKGNGQGEAAVPAEFTTET